MFWPGADGCGLLKRSRAAFRKTEKNHPWTGGLHAEPEDGVSLPVLFDVCRGEKEEDVNELLITRSNCARSVRETAEQLCAIGRGSIPVCFFMECFIDNMYTLIFS